MKRKIYSKLAEWKEQRADKEALLIDGARRVGKSYIVEEFAKNEYRSYILINFAQLTNEMREVFEQYLTDVEALLLRLQILSGIKLYPHESLIIFDEVQRYPKAREAVKWLVADTPYHYIETGSLVSIRTNSRGITIPSEECHTDMYPMDFEEFLWALDQTMLADYIRDCFERQQPLGAALHRKAMDYLRLYMIIGGMPQAVMEYLSSRDFVEVDHVKRNILSLYRNDIYQYAGGDAAKVAHIWDTVPGQLQRKEKRFRIGALKKGARTRDYAEAFFWLEEARVVNTCYAATEPSLGMQLNRDDAKYKLYMADTGLLISHAFNEAEIQDEALYKKLLLNKLEINKGMFVENLVAQLLVASKKKLFYYSQSDKQRPEEMMEIDFLIRKPVVTSKHNICPIEVKSTQRYTTVSLDKFVKKYHPFLHTPYVVHSGEYKQENGVTYLPLYMAGLL